MRLISWSLLVSTSVGREPSLGIGDEGGLAAAPDGEGG